MACSSRFSEVPVVNVTASNIKEVWPSLVLALKTSTFVALDTELSGLGNRKLLGVRSLPDRYKNLCEVARTRSVLSLGLSCFKLQKVGQASISREVPKTDDLSDPHVQVNQWSYSVQTFNVMLLCSEDYTVEPGALKFLVEHGFDFNKQYSSGISYHRGKEETETNSKKPSPTPGPTARQLFDILLWSEVPIVLHNGFVDLVFLYQNFYTDLPPTLQVFLADLAEMFPQGILDTKYSVEFVDRLPATYLEYVFRKWQRKNALQACTERREVCLDFGRQFNSSHVSYSHCGLPSTCVEMDFIPKASVLQELVCPSFGGHGWCSHGKQCSKSHAIDLILDLDGIKAAKNRKRRRKQREMQQQQKDEEDMDQSYPDSNLSISRSFHSDLNTEEDAGSPDSGTAEQKNDADSVDYDTITDTYLKSSLLLEEGRSGGHRAGFDAFMTGFIMACILSKHTSVEDTGERVMGAGIRLNQLSKVDSLTNKVYAMGKDQPMTVSKSNFCHPSKNHRERIQKLRKI